MKIKKFIFIGIVLAGLVIITAIGINYFNLYQELYTVSYWDYVEISDVTKKQSIIIESEERSVYKLCLQIHSRIEGHANVFISDVPNGRSYTIALNNGKEAYFANDWYSDRCFITYEPVDVASGELSINYSFLCASKNKERV